MFTQNNEDPVKKREEVVQGLRKHRRLELLQKKADDYNQTHNQYQVRLFEVPEKLTFDQFK